MKATKACNSNNTHQTFSIRIEGEINIMGFFEEFKRYLFQDVSTAFNLNAMAATARATEKEQWIIDQSLDKWNKWVKELNGNGVDLTDRNICECELNAWLGYFLKLGYPTQGSPEGTDQKSLSKYITQKISAKRAGVLLDECPDMVYQSYNEAPWVIRERSDIVLEHWNAYASDLGLSDVNLANKDHYFKEFTKFLGVLLKLDYPTSGIPAGLDQSSLLNYIVQKVTADQWGILKQTDLPPTLKGTAPPR